MGCEAEARQGIFGGHKRRLRANFASSPVCACSLRLVGQSVRAASRDLGGMFAIAHARAGVMGCRHYRAHVIGFGCLDHCRRYALAA